MADIRIKDLTTTASSSASDDFIAVDGTTNGTRKLNAFSPTFGGNVVVTGTLTSQSTLSTSAGLSCANATITQGYAILTGYGASADAGNLFLGQSSNGNFLNSSLTKIYTAIGGAEISNNVAAGFRVVTTTASTTTSTGALVVSGGVGVGGAINAGSYLRSINSAAANDTEFTALRADVGADGTLGAAVVAIGSLPSATGASRYGFITCSDNTDWRKLYIGGRPGLAPSGGQVLIPSTASSTSTSSGALVVSGGVGVAGAAYFGGTVTVASNFSIASTGFYAGGGTPGAGRFLYSATAGTMLCGQAGSSYDLSLASSTGTVILGVPTGTSNLEAAGSVKTAAPSGGTAAAWKLGTVATVSPTSPNRTIEVDIGGTTYYIHAKTTNN